MAGGDLAPAGGGVGAAHGGARVLSFRTLLLVLATRGWLVISTAQRKASFHEDPARAARSALRRYRGGFRGNFPLTAHSPPRRSRCRAPLQARAAACGRARYAGCRGAIIPVEERPAAAGHSHRRGRRDPRPHQCALERSGLATGLPAPSRLPRPQPAPAAAAPVAASLPPPPPSRPPLPPHRPIGPPAPNLPPA